MLLHGVQRIRDTLMVYIIETIATTGTITSTITIITAIATYQYLQKFTAVATVN